MARRFLITGGAGFIGSNLVRHLVSLGGRIKVLDNLSAGRIEDLQGLPLEIVIGDICNQRLVHRLMKETEVVIHLAAHTNVTRSVENPRIDFDNNVRGTFNLLMSAVRNRVQRFIFASTGGAILGEVDPPVSEEMAPHPISPYGASKLSGEGYCSAFWGSFGLRTISLRFSNVYGPFSYHKGSVIAKFFRQVERGEALTIYGDGSQTRDFLYVGDLCEAIVKALENELPYGQAIQLGTGQETSINHMVAMMNSVVGEKNLPPVHHVPTRVGEVQRNFVSIARAQKYLGFAPQTDLITGLQQTWSWFRQQQHLAEMRAGACFGRRMLRAQENHYFRPRASKECI